MVCAGHRLLHKIPAWSFPRIQTETTWDNSLVSAILKKSESITEMTAKKPRVYVMESQSFNVTPPTGLFLTEVRRWRKFMQMFISAPYFLEMLVAWCWYSSRGKDPTKKGRNAHSKKHGHTPRTQAWLFTEPLQCGTTRNENWGWRYLTSPKQLVYRTQDLDLIRQCGVLLGLSLQQSVHRMHPPLAFDAVQIHPPLLRVMN